MPYPYQYNQPYMPQFQTPSVQPTQPFLTRVRDEQDVINFPVAPGVTAFFIDETAQIIFSKTMDASQLDRPRIVKFKRVPDEPEKVVSYATKEDLQSLRAEFIDLVRPVQTPAPTQQISNGMEVKTNEHTIP